MHYASLVGKIFGIIWKAFCLMQIFGKNLRADLNQVLAFLNQFSPYFAKIISIIIILM